MDVPRKLASTTRAIGVAGRTVSFMDGSLVKAVTHGWMPATALVSRLGCGERSHFGYGFCPGVASGARRAGSSCALEVLRRRVGYCCTPEGPGIIRELARGAHGKKSADARVGRQPEEQVVFRGALSPCRG